MATTAKGQLLSEHRSQHGPAVRQVRGSLVVSSLQTLRELDLFERYLQCLPPQHQDEVLYILAASWIPVELALLHYAACDALQLTDAEHEQIGQRVSQRIMGTFLGTMLKKVRVIAAPVSVPLRQYPRLWERLMLGGGCRVYMTGARQGCIESYGVPMFRYRYFRVAYAGLIRGAGLMFRSTVHVHPRNATDDALVVDVSWA